MLKISGYDGICRLSSGVHWNFAMLIVCLARPSFPPTASPTNSHIHMLEQFLWNPWKLWPYLVTFSLDYISVPIFKHLSLFVNIAVGLKCRNVFYLGRAVWYERRVNDEVRSFKNRINRHISIHKIIKFRLMTLLEQCL